MQTPAQRAYQALTSRPESGRCAWQITCTASAGDTHNPPASGHPCSSPLRPACPPLHRAPVGLLLAHSPFNLLAQKGSHTWLSLPSPERYLNLQNLKRYPPLLSTNATNATTTIYLALITSVISMKSLLLKFLS